MQLIFSITVFLIIVKRYYNRLSKLLNLIPIRMDKEFSNQFLEANRKKFHPDNISAVEQMLSSYSGLNFLLKKNFIGSIGAIVLTWFLTPFDRWIFRDALWGTVKVALFTVAFFTISLNEKHDVINLGLSTSENMIELKTGFIVLGTWLVFIIWQISDLVTARKRVKKMNFKRFVTLVEERGKLA